MKHLIATIATMLALGSAYLVYQSDAEVNKLAFVQKTIAKSEVKVQLGSSNITPITKKEPAKASDEEVAKAQAKKKKELDDKLKALKEKAGNMAAFKVSPLYKQKCSSCHGVNGGGIIGPKLIGQDAETVLKDLREFKSGTRKNYVMYGLLNKMTDEQLKTLADEIGTFADKLKAQQ